MTETTIAHAVSVTSANPFDAAAASYDAAFTETQLGRWLRGMVWERLDASFQAGDRVLDLGCGTGEDALHLARRGVNVSAVDASRGMLHVAERKASQHAVQSTIGFSHLDLSQLTGDEASRQRLLCLQNENRLFDGAYSNFGAANCVANQGALVRSLASVVRPGGKLVLVMMGPVCPWEIFWHLAHRNVAAATRRFRRGVGARIGEGGTVRVWYPSLRRMQRELAPYFRTIESTGLAVLLPPSDMGRLVERAPRLFEMLLPLDRRIGCLSPFKMISDHYLLVVERKP